MALATPASVWTSKLGSQTVTVEAAPAFKAWIVFKAEPSAVSPSLTKAILDAFLIPLSFSSALVTPEPACKYIGVAALTLKNKSKAINLAVSVSPSVLTALSISVVLVAVIIYSPLLATVSEVSTTP